jgi:hypothetical protein
MTLQKAELPVSLMKWRIKFRLLSGVSENMVLLIWQVMEQLQMLLEFSSSLDKRLIKCRDGVKKS